MRYGTLYGIGIGPGDPELITLKGARILSSCAHVFVPKARISARSVALGIARRHINPRAQVHEILFPMTQEREELESRWEESAATIAEVLRTGQDACFLTLGDALLYSTYIYLLRALRRQIPGINVVTVPGVTAFSAAAALTEFALGEGKEPLLIVPTADDLEELRRALDAGGTLVLMKIGPRLNQILDLLQEASLLEQGVFVCRAGMEAQRVETDLGSLRGTDADAGYLSIILVHAHKNKAHTPREAKPESRICRTDTGEDKIA
jgi:precorrin-2/cobalt-factor-2 C20-methyltransferase